MIILYRNKLMSSRYKRLLRLVFLFARIQKHTIFARVLKRTSILEDYYSFMK